MEWFRVPEYIELETIVVPDGETFESIVDNIKEKNNMAILKNPGVSCIVYDPPYDGPYRLSVQECIYLNETFGKGVAARVEDALIRDNVSKDVTFNSIINTYVKDIHIEKVPVEAKSRGIMARWTIDNTPPRLWTPDPTPRKKRLDAMGIVTYSDQIRDECISIGMEPPKPEPRNDDEPWDIERAEHLVDCIGESMAVDGNIEGMETHVAQCMQFLIAELKKASGKIESARTDARDFAKMVDDLGAQCAKQRLALEETRAQARFFAQKAADHEKIPHLKESYERVARGESLCKSWKTNSEVAPEPHQPDLLTLVDTAKKIQEKIYGR